MTGEIIQTNIQLTHKEPVIVEPDGSTHTVTVYPRSYSKDIQGPEETQTSGQLKLPTESAIEKHVAQFWQPSMSNGPDDNQTAWAPGWPREDNNPSSMEGLESQKPYQRLKDSISNIKKEKTIRGVRRAATKAYASGAKGAPLQKIVQEAVARRKAAIKSARGGQEPRQEMSF